jgi:hypothetical protein
VIADYEDVADGSADLGAAAIHPCLDVLGATLNKGSAMNENRSIIVLIMTTDFRIV